MIVPLTVIRLMWQEGPPGMLLFAGVCPFALRLCRSKRHAEHHGPRHDPWLHLACDLALSLLSESLGFQSAFFPSPKPQRARNDSLNAGDLYIGLPNRVPKTLPLNLTLTSEESLFAVKCLFRFILMSILIRFTSFTR